MPKGHPYVFCIDVGSPKKIGWADSKSRRGTGDDLALALIELAHRLKRNEKVALGFEAPIWTPFRSELSEITKSRGGLELSPSRPWSAGAGCGALGVALALMPWCFNQISSAAGPVPATVRLDRFRSDCNLLLWEAFVSGAMKVDGATHHDDAALACDSFMARWPDLLSDIPEQSAFNHAVSSAILAGLDVDHREFSQPSLVIGARN
jgi:hypothetical protein